MLWLLNHVKNGNSNIKIKNKIRKLIDSGFIFGFCIISCHIACVNKTGGLSLLASSSIHHAKLLCFWSSYSSSSD